LIYKVWQGNKAHLRNPYYTRSLLFTSRESNSYHSRPSWLV